ncbi:uveal autoantigen with coiled-coil domains and ankyrin repeats-like [Astyanax mexicanus]|uniref:Uveal autoantigen with coiled-coil domains and ankyrin repeats n=1 Tax=Astyanax mexicanus TaxID=7994 RepID=A0A8B9L4S0_ASTMX|nr:uveal autoantigen with coiled-coil domains and ankyrin repeats-like [Astyanax mexicanus]
MKSLKQRLKKHELSPSSSEWSKYDERLLRAVENGDIDRVTATLKKGAIPTRLDAEGCSALHLAASKGLINSLNVFLGHGVNLHATDASGKTALHLSSGGGHSACVQRLLQCKSPVDSTDLQGRTALHDAAYSGRNTIIKMLCDSGASVSAVDTDGRSPLLLAAQMSHPRACQQLLLCGASTNLRDKQNKTALILACEHPCREVVEVLLKNKADVTAVDLYNHDPLHYARLSNDQVLITMVQQILEAASKAQEAAKTAQKLQQQRSMNAEAQAHMMRKLPAHAPVKVPSSGISWSSTGVPPQKLEKVPAQQHSREHSSRSPDGKDEPQAPLDSAQVRHFSPHSASPASVVLPPRPVEVRAGEVEVLRRELWQARRRLEAAEEEVLRLDATLALRAREYEDLRRNSERALQEAHGRSWELEEALAEVQRRMAGSEARVRQMQAHLVTVRENLVEELRVQLHDARTHREAAVAELERTREELGHHQREVEEQKERSGALLQEVQRLTEELLSKDEHTKALKASLANLEARKAQMACKHIQTPSEWQLKSSKTTMTDITSEILQQEMDKNNYISRDEHTKALKSTLAAAEAKRIEMACKNVQTTSEWQPVSSKATMTDITGNILQQEMGKNNYISIEEHNAMRSSLSAVLQQAESRAQEAQQRQQQAEQENLGLLAELQEQKTELDTLQEALQARFVPVALLEEKERELSLLRLTLKEMEKSKDKKQNFGKTHKKLEDTRNPTTVKSQNQQVSQNRRESSLSGTPEETSEGQQKEAESAVEAETQRESQVSSSASSRPCRLQQSESSTLQAHINSLQQQLEDSERRYRRVLDMYRTRLLNAAQGYMDEEARMALLQIAQMRQECVY